MYCEHVPSVMMCWLLTGECTVGMERYMMYASLKLCDLCSTGITVGTESYAALVMQLCEFLRNSIIKNLTRTPRI